MKVFKDLEISIPADDRATFFDRIEHLLDKGWIRDHDKEKLGAERGDGVFYIFVCEQKGDRQAALLAFATRSANTVYVSNIVPNQISQLDYDQYNLILTEFHDLFVSLLAKEMGISVKLTDESQTLEDWISRSTADKLRRFSASANKSTGSSHPHDEDRWYEFLVSVILENDDIYSSRLRRWLVEEGGWSDDIADKLSGQFEEGIDLLKFYRKKVE